MKRNVDTGTRVGFKGVHSGLDPIPTTIDSGGRDPSSWSLDGKAVFPVSVSFLRASFRHRDSFLTSTYRHLSRSERVSLLLHGSLFAERVLAQFSVELFFSETCLGDLVCILAIYRIIFGISCVCFVKLKLIEGKFNGKEIFLAI